MKTRFLFPHSWRMAGYLCFVAFIVFSITLKFLHPEGVIRQDFNGVSSPNQFRDILHTDIKILLVVVGLLVVAFSKEKIEDEQIAQQRLDSLQWAVYVNYAIFILCVVLVNGITFLEIVLYNVVTPLVIFIIRFRWKIYSLNRLLKNS